ncbi:SwmB domain-containing protein [Flavivirga rizhaonensis]|uniref:PKD domain-containing protein n=1 Tax=Flavivirga rizhaonensis TaxID=2559571 RepID=A0A4S1DS52_9FLAO|nr:SwmB domain-containing protein [Flavivirga rizhaonensis]TGV00786.1 hypothetical protein EM932_18180 [Flavivirga rizhaonensis]
MKKYSFIILLFVAFWGCDKDDFERLSDNTQAQIFTPSIFQINENSIGRPIAININNFSSISDASQGVVSRSWAIEEGARYLKSTFERKDSLNLAAFIDPNLGLGNSAEIVHVLFQKEGETLVTLKNKFNKEVSLYGNTAVQGNDGLWQLTTELTYDVYADLNTEASISNEDDTQVLATLSASQNPSSDDTSGFATITIEAGSSLTFTDLTTIGRPDERLWEFEGGTPSTSTEEKQAVTFNRLGDYLVMLTTFRDKVGSALNPAEQTKTIPAIITVIPSTKPYVITGNASAEDDSDDDAGTNIITLSVNGEIDAVSGVEGNFTVNVQNIGFNQNFTVTSARKSNDDATTVELTLDQPILNSDTVTLSYNGTGITSIDSRTLETFTDVPVDPVNKNLLTNASNPSMENSVDNDRNVNTQGYNLFVGGGGNNLDNARNVDGSLQINRTTERASDGVASLKFDAVMPLMAPALSISNRIISNSNIIAGEYKLTFDVFVEESTGTFTVLNVIQGGEPRGQSIMLDPPVIGEWFTIERNFTLAAELQQWIVFNFRNQDNAGITGRQVFYIDNLQVIALETR